MRVPFGVEPRYLLSMSVQERENLLLSHGAASDTDLMRQHATATDDVSATNPLRNLLDELKEEHRSALENGQERDAIRMQHMMMQIAQAIQSGSTEPDEFYNRCATMYQNLADKAQSENRSQSALYYGRRGSDYRGDA